MRAGLVKPSQGQSLLDYPWSSLARAYAAAPGRRAKWMAVEEGLAAFGLKDTLAGRKKMVGRTDRRAVEEEGQRCGVPLMPEEIDARCSHLRRGWFWGTQAFSEEALKIAKVGEPRSRIYRSTAEYRSHGMEQAERWLREGLAAAGVEAGELEKRAGNDPVKVALADVLWHRTVASQQWLARELAMKSAANVSQILRSVDRGRLRRGLGKDLRGFLKRCGEIQSAVGEDSRFDT